MLKVIALIKRRADLARAEFRQHYEEIHVPLALRHIDQFRKYVRNHVTAEVAGGSAAFDCLTELWYADQTALQSVLTYLQSAAAEPIRLDERSFMAKQENVFFPVEEQLIYERGTLASGAVDKMVALAVRSPELPIDAFRKRYAATLLAWCASQPAPLRCLQNVVLRTEAPAAPWDVITMLWYPAGSACPPPVVPHDLGRGVILTVCECETPLA